MRDPARIDRILGELGTLWKRVPDWRLGQLFGNIALHGTTYYTEDDALITRIREFLNVYAPTREPDQHAGTDGVPPTPGQDVGGLLAFRPP